jgi:hypothetical protein
VRQLLEVTRREIKEALEVMTNHNLQSDDFKSLQIQKLGERVNNLQTTHTQPVSSISKRKIGICKKEGPNNGKYFSTDIDAAGQEVPKSFKWITLEKEPVLIYGEKKDGTRYSVLATDAFKGEHISGTYTIL